MGNFLIFLGGAMIGFAYGITVMFSVIEEDACLSHERAVINMSTSNGITVDCEDG